MHFGFTIHEIYPMKNKLILLVVLAIFSNSCNQDDKNPDFNILGYWNLKEIRPSWTIPGFDGTQFVHEEKYIFNTDNSFIKISNQSKEGRTLDVSNQALGTYTIKPIEHNGEGLIFELVLKFDTNETMAANCGEGPIENLYVNKDFQLLNASATACDGPLFLYAKR